MAALSIVSEIRRDLGHIVSDFQRLPASLVVLKLFLRYIAAKCWRTCVTHVLLSLSDELRVLDSLIFFETTSSQIMSYDLFMTHP